jgi:hypothetical protein
VSTHVSSRSTTFPRVVRVPRTELSGVRVGLVSWGGLAVLDLARLAAPPSFVAVGALARVTR